MIVLLADNHLAYRGTLTDMCKFLDVASRDSRTNAKIKTAIENLEKSGKIKTIKDGNTWTLTLAKKAERDKQIIRIRKDWITALRECDKCGVDWSASLKVWLYFIEHGNEITTNEKNEGRTCAVRKHDCKSEESIEWRTVGDYDR